MKCLYASAGRQCQLDEGHSGEHDYKPFPSFLDQVHTRIDELERVVAELRAAVIVSPAGLGGPVPRLELPADALQGAMSLVPGCAVIVSMDRGGVWLGRYVGEVAGGVSVDLGGRAGTLTVAADRVLPAPESWC